MSLARAGKLADTGTLGAEVERMLSDPRAEVLVRNFALAWLNVDDLKAVEPDSQIFAGEFSDTFEIAEPCGTCNGILRRR